MLFLDPANRLYYIWKFERCHLVHIVEAFPALHISAAWLHMEMLLKSMLQSSLVPHSQRSSVQISCVYNVHNTENLAWNKCIWHENSSLPTTHNFWCACFLLNWNGPCSPKICEITRRYQHHIVLEIHLQSRCELTKLQHLIELVNVWKHVEYPTNHL